jgi:hypothetical protein
VETTFVKIKIQSTNMKHTNPYINTQQRSWQKKKAGCSKHELDNIVFIASSTTNIIEKVSQIKNFGCKKSEDVNEDIEERLHRYN